MTLTAPTPSPTRPLAPPRALPDGLEALAACAAAQARDALLGLQNTAGWWKGELQTNVTMDAEDLFLREFLGIRTAGQTSASAAWIRAQQREDGTWTTFYGGPPDLSTTVEAYVALRLAGDPPDADHMRAAAAFVRDAGGLERSRVFTRIWLALFGLWPWGALPVMPPEMILLPSWFPLNIYDFACWARQTIVPLTVVSAHRPVRPGAVSVEELRTGTTPRRPLSAWTWAGWFELLDAVLQRYERAPIASLRRLSLARAERWILRRQEADGSWGGIQPPWVYSLVALHLLGYGLDHPVIRAGLEGLEGFIVADEQGRRLEACQSPVWDTALAIIALTDAGLAADHPAVRRACRWLLDQEVRGRGDWAVRRARLQPGGWAFEFHNQNYPDIDDTAEVVLALARVGRGTEEWRRARPAVGRAVAWLEGMQCRSGGWGAFDVDNTRALCRELSFCDFGELIDPPSADVTAHVVEMLISTGHRDQRVDAALRWLSSQQEKDGSWFGRWGANHIYGTGAVVPALIAAGVDAGDHRVVRAVRWLHTHQNEDGGWGEDLRSYDDPAWRGHGPSTASQTAWALLALLTAGERTSPAVQGGVAWLVARQREDGTWDEPWFTGTGFPGDFYINYELYRLVFPLMALGRYVQSQRGCAIDG